MYSKLLAVDMTYTRQAEHEQYLTTGSRGERKEHIKRQRIDWSLSVAQINMHKFRVRLVESRDDVNVLE